MKYHIEIHGCQMNYADAERVATVCERNDYSFIKDWRQADLVIFLSCSIKQKAEDKIIGHMKELAGLKKVNKNLKVGISGCMVRQTSTQAEQKKDKILESLTTVDFVFRMEDLDQLDYILRDKTPVEPGRVFGDPSYIKKVEPTISSPFKALIPIMTGCNNYCSYCIVPYARGRERSRPISEIIADARSFAGRGIKEILLLGQNVNSYGNTNSVYDENIADDNKHSPFTRLLIELNKIKEIKRIRFTSPHPKDVTEELIKAMSELENVCEHIHLPLQSGDDSVLERMNRHYTAKHFLNLVKMVRKYMPRAGISTDVIVGFCGETEKEFQNTLKVCNKAKFDLSYHSMYSERTETYAGRFLKDDILKKEKQKRYYELNELIKKSSYAINKKYLGEVWEVLVDKIEDGTAMGKTRTNRSVRFPADKNTEEGDFADVEITRAREWVLEGSRITRNSRITRRISQRDINNRENKPRQNVVSSRY